MIERLRRRSIRARKARERRMARETLLCCEYLSTPALHADWRR
jgi:hypothetical protein